MNTGLIIFTIHDTTLRQDIPVAAGVTTEQARERYVAWARANFDTPGWDRSTCRVYFLDGSGIAKPLEELR